MNQKESKTEQRVLSIQSHVVSGYVGNKAAVFPLQLLGYDVDIINSVHFSNHTGHPNGFEGEVMNGDQLKLILKGLERNNLLSNIHHLLTGYIGSSTFLRSVIHVLRTLKSYNPDVRYVCDPVLGDDGKVYVPEELVAIYRDEVIPMANVVTPNQFEVELLTGIQITSIEDGIRATRALHDLGPELVIITSLTCTSSPSSSQVEDTSSSNNGTITILASERILNKHTNMIENSIWSIDTPKVLGRFTGTGDVTAALVLAWTSIHKKNINDDHQLMLKGTLERIASTMYTLIKYTADNANDSVASRELKLIQCKDMIENPEIMFQARKVL